MADNGDKRDVTVKVILDFILLALLPQISLVILVAIEPFHRGFFCDDQSITYPYKPNTVSTLTVGAVGVSVPVIVMIVTELVYYKNQLRGISFKDSASLSQYRACGKVIHPYLAALYSVIGPFLFGAGVTLTCTDVGKYSIGRLRPHFISVCKPDWGSFNCTDERGSMLYITDPSVCTGDIELITEARVSHPSGHSSFAVYALVYLVLYMEVRLTWKGSKLLRHFIQVLTLYLAMWVCFSRISDYQHHWSDVLGGGALGASVAIVTALYLTSLYPRVTCFSFREASPTTAHAEMPGDLLANGYTACRPPKPNTNGKLGAKSTEVVVLMDGCSDENGFTATDLDAGYQ